MKEGSIAFDCGSNAQRASSLLCRVLPISFKYDVSPMELKDGERVNVIFSSQSTNAIIYVMVVLVIYIVIFIALVITSYRKSVSIRRSLTNQMKEHNQQQSMNFPMGETVAMSDVNSANSANYGATLVVDCNQRGEKVRTETLEFNGGGYDGGNGASMGYLFGQEATQL